MPVTLDTEAWGFDHGSWGVLIKMYPQADIPDGSVEHRQHQTAGLASRNGAEAGPRCVMKALCWWPAATWCITCAPPAGMARTRRTSWAESFNNYVKANLQWQGLDEQHPLVNYLAPRRGLALQPDGGALSLPLLLMSWGRGMALRAMTIPVDGIEIGSLSMLSVLVGA